MAARAALSPGSGRRRFQARALRRRRPQPRPFVRLGDGSGALAVRSPPASPGLAVSRVPLLSPLAAAGPGSRFRLPTPRLRSSLSPPRRGGDGRRRRLLLSGAPGPARSPPLAPPPPPPGASSARAATGWARSARKGPPVAAHQRPPGTRGPSPGGRGCSAGVWPSRRPHARVRRNGWASRPGGETPEPTPQGGRAAPFRADLHPELGQRREPPAGEQPSWACAAAGEGPRETERRGESKRSSCLRSQG